jgi:hypothetical protein
VDEAVMQERIKALQEDANKAKLLQQLTSENEKLRAEMTALAQQRAQELDSEKLATIVAREATLRKDLATNLTSTEQVFKSVVSAIDIANQEALARKSEFDKIAAEWELNFFQPLRSPKILKADVVDMKLSDDGTSYSGQIVIEYQNDPDGKIVKFACPTDGILCGKDHNEVVWFYRPALMSKDNEKRFHDMVTSKLDLYSITYKLGDKIGVSPVRIGYNRYYSTSDHEAFFLDTNVKKIATKFQVDVAAMQSNPILKADIITPQQCLQIAQYGRALSYTKGSKNIFIGDYPSEDGCNSSKKFR